MRREPFLILAGSLSLPASLLHLAQIGLGYGRAYLIGTWRAWPRLA